MQVGIDDAAYHVGDLFDHLLALDWEATLNDGPWVLACFLEGKSRQLLPVLRWLADGFDVLLYLGKEPFVLG